jgi:hypothetical protein
MVNFLLFFGGVVVGVLVEHFLFKQNTPSDDDPTGEKKQEIYNKLNQAISDIKSTI